MPPIITVYYHQAPDEREKRLRGVPVMSPVIRGEEQIRQKQSSKHVYVEQTLAALIKLQMTASNHDK